MASSSETTIQQANWVFSSLGCVEMTLEEQAGLVQRAGLDGVELRGVEARMDLPVLWAEQFGEPARLRARLEELGLRVHALDSSFKLIGATPQTKADLLGFGEWADGIGVGFIRVFDGGRFETPLAEADLRAAVENFHWWREERARRGWQVDIMVETHDALCSGANCVALREAAGTSVPILWDAHHTWRKGGEAPEKTWAMIQEDVPHIHFKDSVDRPSAKHPFSYVHLGEGQFPLAAFAGLLARDGYTGVLSLEWERQWHPYLPPVEEALLHPGFQAFRTAFVEAANASK